MKANTTTSKQVQKGEPGIENNIGWSGPTLAAGPLLDAAGASPSASGATLETQQELATEINLVPVTGRGQIL